MQNSSKVLLIFLTLFIVMNAVEIMQIHYQVVSPLIPEELVKDITRPYYMVIVINAMVLIMLFFLHLKGYFKACVWMTVTIFILSELYLRYGI